MHRPLHYITFGVWCNQLDQFTGVMSPILPTVTFKKELEVILAGDLQIKLIHSPGETDDQILVWLPKIKTLIPGDNIYK